ncbi:MAG: 50S ribosomal protein L23 [bacterium]|nr:50S ribosomal protein L23 [bacterium]
MASTRRTKTTPAVSVPAPAVTGRGGASYSVLLEPYLTEKSSILAERGQYTFLVHLKAEKIQIARAITERYQVHPVRVWVLRTPGKHVRHGRTTGWRSGVKKAIVTLADGETMPFGVRT